MTDPALELAEKVAGVWVTLESALQAWSDETMRFAWDESLHPRGPDGKFKSKEEAVDAAKGVFDVLDYDSWKSVPGFADAAKKLVDGDFGFGELAKLANVLDEQGATELLDEDIWQKVEEALEDHSKGADASAEEEGPDQLVRTYKGTDHVVTAGDGVWEYDGQSYKSLTAVARAITGQKAISGPAFFKNAKKQKGTPPEKETDEPTQEPGQDGANPEGAKAAVKYWTDGDGFYNDKMVDHLAEKFNVPKDWLLEQIGDHYAGDGVDVGMASAAKKAMKQVTDDGQVFTPDDVEWYAKNYNLPPEFVKGMMGDNLKTGSGFDEVTEGAASDWQGLDAADQKQALLDLVNPDAISDHLSDILTSADDMDDLMDTLIGIQVNGPETDADSDAVNAMLEMAGYSDEGVADGGDKPDEQPEQTPEEMALEAEMEGHAAWYESNADVDAFKHYKTYDQLAPKVKQMADYLLAGAEAGDEMPQSKSLQKLLELAIDNKQASGKPEPHEGAVAGKDTSKTPEEINEGLNPPAEDKLTKVYNDMEWTATKDADGTWYATDSDGNQVEGKSLTALAKKITGYKSISGPQFFGANKKGAKGKGKAKPKPDPKGTPVIHAGGPPPEFKGWTGGDHVRVLDGEGKIRDVRVVKQLKSGNALLLDQASGAYFESSPEGVVAWLKADGSKVEAEKKTDLSPGQPGGAPNPDFRSVLNHVFGSTPDEKRQKLDAAVAKLKANPSAPPPTLGDDLTPYPDIKPKVNASERAALASYTGSGSYEMNDAMRGKGGPPSSSTLAKINRVQRLMDALPDKHPPYRILRGTGVRGMCKHLGLPDGSSRHFAAAMQALMDKNATFTLNGFVSSSSSPGVAQGFKKAEGVMFDFTTPKMLPVKHLKLPNTSEMESMMGHAWEYKPTGIKYHKGVGYVISCDVIPHPVNKKLTAADFAKLGTGK